MDKVEALQKKKGDGLKTTAEELEIEAMLAKLYKLTPEEQKAVLAFNN